MLGFAYHWVLKILSDIYRHRFQKYKQRVSSACWLSVSCLCSHQTKSISSWVNKQENDCHKEPLTVSQLLKLRSTYSLSVILCILSE